jgi:hypothetical protein
LKDFLILRRPRSGRLEERTPLIDARGNGRMLKKYRINLRSAS